MRRHFSVRLFLISFLPICEGLLGDAERPKALDGSISCLHPLEGPQRSLAPAIGFPCFPRRAAAWQPDWDEPEFQLAERPHRSEEHPKTLDGAHRQEHPRQSVNFDYDDEEKHLILRDASSGELLEDWILSILTTSTKVSRRIKFPMTSRRLLAPRNRKVFGS